jgi:predicted outer membrane protein
MNWGIRLRLIGTAARALCLISPSLVAAQNATQLPTNEGNMLENLTIPDRQPHPNAVDREFAEGAASSARRQITDADSALRASQRTDVKHIASMLRGDGERIGRKLAGIGAAGSGEAAVDGVAKSKISAYNDGAFIADQIEMQFIEIGLFQRECRLGADAGLRTFANLTLPALQRNLQRLQALPVD